MRVRLGGQLSGAARKCKQRSAVASNRDSCDARQALAAGLGETMVSVFSGDPVISVCGSFSRGEQAKTAIRRSNHRTVRTVGTVTWPGKQLFGAASADEYRRERERVNISSPMYCFSQISVLVKGPLFSGFHVINSPYPSTIGVWKQFIIQPNKCLYLRMAWEVHTFRKSK